MISRTTGRNSWPGNVPPHLTSTTTIPPQQRRILGPSLITVINWLRWGRGGGLFEEVFESLVLYKLSIAYTDPHTQFATQSLVNCRGCTTVCVCQKKNLYCLNWGKGSIFYNLFRCVRSIVEPLTAYGAV